tara:strand:- start:3 stop:506 length:504 start_codon:yes stop_codon:yes gene_type:complete
MLEKNNENKGVRKRKGCNRDESEGKYQSPDSTGNANDWQRTPDWAINYVTPTIPVSELISVARKIERRQHIREENLGDGLASLGETAWKILVQLVIATEEGKSMSLLGMSDRISLPEAIANRYVNILETKGHIVRLRHPTDQGADHLELTDKGHSIMRKTLLEVDKI